MEDNMNQPLTPPSLLIIEDSPEILTRILEAVSVLQGGETVTVARTTAEAFFSLRTRTPDIVILDCNIAGESGYNVLEAIRSSDQGTYVIAWTNDPNIVIMRRYLEAGANIFLDKTHEFDELVPLIRNHLRIRSNMDAR